MAGFNDIIFYKIKKPELCEKKIYYHYF